MRNKELLRWSAIFALFTLFNSGKWALAPAAWIAPALGLYIIHRTATDRGFFRLYLAMYLPLSIAWYGAVPFPMPIYPIFMLFNTLVGTLPYLLDRLLAPRLGRSFATTLVFPLAATAVEFVMMAEGPLGSFGAQAYTQYDFLPFVQFVSVAGLWGITFIVSWFASVAHWAATRYEAGQPFRHGVVAYTVVVAMVVLFGSARLLLASQPQENVSIASFTAVHVDMGQMMSLRETDEMAFRERTRTQHAAYLEQSVEAAQAGAQIVLWPELAGLGMVDDVERLVASGRALANKHDIYLAMPLYIVDPTDAATRVNKIVVADPDGAIVLEHVKYGGNLLEGTLLGSRDLQTVETPFGTLSAVICWDTDYPAVIRQAGTQNVDILLSPAYVWPEVAAIHAEMAVFRSIENGMTVVRHSDNGFSLTSDPYGRIVVQENHIGQEAVMLAASAPVMAVQTLYPIVGDVVGQLAVAGLILLIVAVLALRFRRVSSKRTPVTAEVA